MVAMSGGHVTVNGVRSGYLRENWSHSAVIITRRDSKKSQSYLIRISGEDFAGEMVYCADGHPPRFGAFPIGDANAPCMGILDHPDPPNADRPLVPSFDCLTRLCRILHCARKNDECHLVSAKDCKLVCTRIPLFELKFCIPIDTVFELSLPVERRRASYIQSPPRSGDVNLEKPEPLIGSRTKREIKQGRAERKTGVEGRPDWDRTGNVARQIERAPWN
jgi:hypothetical protein